MFVFSILFGTGFIYFAAETWKLIVLHRELFLAEETPISRIREHRPCLIRGTVALFGTAIALNPLTGVPSPFFRLSVAGRAKPRMKKVLGALSRAAGPYSSLTALFGLMTAKSLKFDHASDFRIMDSSFEVQIEKTPVRLEVEGLHECLPRGSLPARILDALEGSSGALPRKIKYFELSGMYLDEGMDVRALGKSLPVYPDAPEAPPRFVPDLIFTGEVERMIDRNLRYVLFHTAMTMTLMVLTVHYASILF